LFYLVEKISRKKEPKLTSAPPEEAAKAPTATK